MLKETYFSLCYVCLPQGYSLVLTPFLYSLMSEWDRLLVLEPLFGFIVSLNVRSRVNHNVSTRSHCRLGVDLIHLILLRESFLQHNVYINI